MSRLVASILAFGLLVGVAQAQLSLPFLTPTPAPAAAPPAAAAPTDLGGPASPAKPKRRAHRAAAPASTPAAADSGSAFGRTLKLNGRNGELKLERGDDGALHIVKYALLGEVVSNPSQPCHIDIIADKPIEAVSKGEPDGLPRYSADIPACPLAFDVVSDGVLVAPQTNACVFTVADCQASPSGLWGPEAAELDAKAVSKARAAADRSIQDSLRIMEKRDKDAAAALAREQNDFAAERDDTCREYAGETRLGFCASRLAQSRAALLARRAAEGPAPHEAAAGRKRLKKKATQD
jgi:hypothetical protein